MATGGVLGFWKEIQKMNPKPMTIPNSKEGMSN